MVDSYLAPADLAEARQRARAAANAAAGQPSAGQAPGKDGYGAIVELIKAPLERQRHLITAETRCVIADFVLWNWDEGSLSELADALRPDRILVFVEPTADLGWRQAVHRLGRRVLRLVLRYDFEADVPAALRAAGLTVTTTNRFGTGPADIRSYVVGQAKHYEI